MRRNPGSPPSKPIRIAGAGLTAALLAAATPLLAQEGRMLTTMPHGEYQCAMPGDAAGDAFEPRPEESFSIGTASRYFSARGKGVYLMRGKELVFTRGPRKGEEFRRIGRYQLQRVNPDGKLAKLLCTRIGPAD